MSNPIAPVGSGRVAVPQPSTARAGAPSFSARLATSAVVPMPPSGGTATLGQQVVQAARAEAPGGGFAGAVAAQYGSEPEAQLAAMLRVQLAVQKENQWFTTMSNAKKALSSKPIADNMK